MITVEWQDQLSDADAAELAELIAEAAAYDEEAGFSTAVPAPADPGDAVVRQAVARLTPDRHGAGGTPLVAFLRLDIDRAGGAQAQLLVRRGYRSLGIGTLMIERLSEGSESADEGWAGTGAVSISCWAHGNHPAAERMARRLGAETGRSRWKMMRGDEARYIDAEDEPAVLAARREGFVHEHTDVCHVWRVPVRAR